MSERKRRSREDLYFEVLNAVKDEPQKVTHIAGDIDSSVKRTKVYLEELMKAECVEKKENKYSITEDGERVIELMNDLKEKLGEK